MCKIHQLFHNNANIKFKVKILQEAGNTGTENNVAHVRRVIVENNNFNTPTGRGSVEAEPQG